MKNLMLTALAALSVQAFAEGSKMGSEYMYQAPADKFAVTPYLGYQKVELDLKPSTGFTKQEVSGTNFGVIGQYGISEMFATGLELKTSSMEYEFSPTAANANFKQSGMHDLRAFFNGRMDMGGGSFRFGTDVNFAMKKPEWNVHGKGPTNNGSGGISLRPFVGYEMYMNACTIGSKLSYLTYIGDRKGTDKSSTGDESIEISKGETVIWSLFYEHNLAPLTLGASFEWESIGGTDVVYTTSKTKGEINGHSEYRLNLYAPYELSPMITLLPQVTWGKWSAFDNTEISGGDLMGLQLAGRFSF